VKSLPSVLLVGSELPGCQLGGRVFEAVDNGGVDVVTWEAWEAFTVERVARGREIQVIGGAAAGDVDVCLGSGRGRIDPAGR
jgi:hypothetical protein